MSGPVVRVVGFDELTSREAYRLWQLRSQVFVVDQSSPYLDLDGRDLEATTRHVLLEEDGELLGCARVLRDGEVCRVGRVVVAPSARGRSLGDVVVRAALAECGDAEVRLDAQRALTGWYASYGFDVAGEDFDEDGVLHTPMWRPAGAS
ncbi:MAG: GNAT family N-acetyltransferase [Nocardioides sp.]|uniref:GNAT family N-acetyltransferase n=1 Tax=Nocardioides sp. TaxID=35761 RepID=UPI003F073BC1